MNKTVCNVGTISKKIQAANRTLIVFGFSISCKNGVLCMSILTVLVYRKITQFIKDELCLIDILNYRNFTLIYFFYFFHIIENMSFSVSNFKVNGDDDQLSIDIRLS